MAADIEAGGLGVDADAEFHAAVTAAGHNHVLADLMEYLAAPIAETRVESLSQPDRPPKSLANHRRIASAIADRDPRRAARAMRAHIKVVADVQLLRWEPPDGTER
jgi:GntR family transcriptional repressor for pyruvate dehydrogenase complex